MKHSLLIALFIVGYSSQAWSTPPRVEVDVLVIQHDIGQQPLHEQFDAPLPSPLKRRRFIQLNAPGSDNPNYRQLHSARLQLRAEDARLRRSAHYHRLAYTGWEQPLLHGRHAVWVAPFAQHEDLSVDGLVRLHAKNDYHVQVSVDFQLYLTQAQAQSLQLNLTPAAKTQALVGVPLHANAALKLGEVYYFDNPVYGVLMKVSPLR